MTIKLALIRHGHTQWNLDGKIQGRTDVPLTAEATDQLGALELPADWQNATVVSSPLLRACLLYTSPSPRDATLSRMPSSA